MFSTNGGRVLDFFIPSKRDKNGKRFGFVRMTEFFNAKELELQLERIWLGSYKPRVNVMRFERRLQETFKSRNKGIFQHGKALFERGEMSYAKVVSRGK